MTNPSKIERAVMRRVHTIHLLRPFVSGTALALSVGAVALWGIGREVWVARVFQNAPHNAADAIRFYLYAFDHTHLLVQALSLVVFGSLVYLARATARIVAVSLPFARA